MPETQFRVGDRIEVRRMSEIPERFRQKRGEVVRVDASTGLVGIRLVNPPTGEGELEHHGGWWAPHWLRLVERQMRIGPGARVIVSSPAYTRPGGTGGVNREFYGAECIVHRPCEGHPNNWWVRLADHPESENHVHENFLTVIEEAVPSAFQRNDLAVVERPAYRTEEPAGYARIPVAVQQRVVQVSSTYGGVCVVRSDLGTYEIHQRWLTPYVDDAEPMFQVGDVVITSAQPKRWSPEHGDISSGYGNQVGVVFALSASTRPEVLFPSGASATIHQSHLSRLPVERPEQGTPVRIREDAQRLSGATLMHLSSSVMGQVGRVTNPETAQGNVKVTLKNGREAAVYPYWLSTLTEEEYERALSTGDRVRMNLDAPVSEGSALRGRVLTVTEVRPVQIYVSHDEIGVGEYVDPEHVTRIVSTGETGAYRCRYCRVPTDDPVRLNGRRYCHDCVATCAHCSETHAINDHYTPSIHYSRDQWVCETCTALCGGCQVRTRRTEMRRSGIRYYCGSCARECEETGCTETAIGVHRYCNSCRNDVGPAALGSWRRTVPTMWLGGPVRSTGGYYIGFEHEVSASGDYRLKPLRRWAGANLGSPQGLDPKPDSSVRGFEIATQPMTPAFFESVDWDSYMQMLDEAYPIRGGRGEPDTHGLHVHIGRQAFRTEKTIHKDELGRRLKKPRKVMVTDTAMLAAFTLLLSRGHDHLERIGRRSGSSWAVKVDHPVKAAITHDFSDKRYGRQYEKIINGRRVAIPRGAVNLTNPKTIEIRAAASTRSADELRAAVRVVYLAAEYVRHLRKQGKISPQSVNWEAFSVWVAEVMPEAHAVISGRVDLPMRLAPVTTMSVLEPTPEALELAASGVVNTTMEVGAEGTEGAVDPFASAV